MAAMSCLRQRFQCVARPVLDQFVWALLFVFTPPLAAIAALVFIFPSCADGGRMLSGTLKRAAIRMALFATTAMALIATILTLADMAKPQRIISVGHMQVDLTDLDPSTHAGADRALRRIRSAAEQACDTQSAEAAQRQLERMDCLGAIVGRAAENAGPVVAQHYAAAYPPRLHNASTDTHTR